MADHLPRPMPAQRRHHEATLRYAQRHFTDPEMHAADAAILTRISERTQRESLCACGTSWRTITQDLRLERAAELLSATNYKIAVVARLSGYRSAPALAAVFRERHGVPPAQYRRKAGGQARAGGPTGAFRKPAERARALKEGFDPPSMRRSWHATAGDAAITDQEEIEARERIGDRRMFRLEGRGGISIAELTEEVTRPRHPSNEPDEWREGWARFDQWVEVNDVPTIDDDTTFEEMWLKPTR